MMPELNLELGGRLLLLGEANYGKMSAMRSRQTLRGAVNEEFNLLRGGENWNSESDN